MFDEISLKKIDAKYFNIILLDNKDITLQSRNTGHYWYLHCTEYPEEQSLIIFHKHFFRCPYHQHGKANTLNQAVRSIKEHDKFQLEVRKCELKLQVEVLSSPRTGLLFELFQIVFYPQEFYQQFWQKNNLEVRYLSYTGSQLNADNLPEKR